MCIHKGRRHTGPFKFSRQNISVKPMIVGHEVVTSELVGK